MADIGIRLLKLQREFAERDERESLAKEFSSPELQPRSEAEIGADYEAALLELLRLSKIS
ncbi:hypothetical protein [Paenarthrobacter nitroguajacolicus]|uniref:hypothetical protein n=1 Tax=Paenarthrobacter nitroguajacolicus TaxID=211146 RepID=UPI0015BFE386|nr:hypothetical protein [Paenarthrobacter nitroguajacolicus]